jgi:hypothetical protein
MPDYIGRVNRSWRWLLLVIVSLVVAGCSRGGNPRTVGLTNIPLPSGARVMTQARSCDKGVNAYCSVQVVVVGDGYSSSADLRATYEQQLAKLGWTSANGPDGNETAADSPGHELHLTYATAYQDLLGVDSNWVQRRPGIARALSAAVFDRGAAISIMLVKGSS